MIYYFYKTVFYNISKILNFSIILSSIKNLWKARLAQNALYWYGPLN